MKTILFLILLLPTLALPQPLTLEDCFELAYKHLEFDEQTQSYLETADLAEKNAGKNWLPKIVLDGTFTYQNENISIPISTGVPGFVPPNAPQNFNRLVLNFTQTIYDGSLTTGQKNLERSKYTMLAKQLEIEKIKTRSQVISFFMAIQLAHEKLAILRSRRQVIAEHRTSLTEAAKFGGAAVLNIKTLEAEILMIDQGLIEARHTHTTLVNSLSEIIGRTLPPDQVFLRPEPQVSYSGDVGTRPEIQLLDLQVENLDLQKSLVSTSQRPRLNAFGSLGTGKPGYDIFNDEVAFMGLIGLNVQWQIFDWGRAKNQKQILAADQTFAQFKRRRLQTQLRTELKKYEQEIRMMEELLAKDGDLVEIRAEVSAIKTAQLQHGVITATDYLTELNLEDEARLNQKIHELRLAEAKLNYLTMQGNR